MSYLSIASMLAFTTFPVLVPAIITAGHAILSWISKIPAGRMQVRAVVDVIH
jgi:hypothetical protein